ncbi:MAG TPA: CARDB domain-containing protein, partial [Terriglobia bacterium]|nr:CARDB domain-containing protein [Terriglobia bacterium]
DDIVLGKFDHTGGLAEGTSYSRTETMFGPASGSGRYNVFVITDSGKVVFENGNETNNSASAPSQFDLMPFPYADLKMISVNAPATAQSGNLLTVTWVVRNDGIGRTDLTQWSDIVTLARNADGTNAVTSVAFDHIGVLEVGGQYERTASLTLPNTLSGTFYVMVKTSGPYEFIFNNSLNIGFAGPVIISQSPSPDLFVTSISAPTSANESDSIDITWTVRNIGLATAAGSWTDTVFLRKPGMDPADPATPRPIVLGSFTYSTAVDPGISYTRTERFKLPARIEGLWQVVVTTDQSDRLYEGNPEPANNTTADDATILLSLLPRPDLQVQTMTAPDTVTAGSTAAVSFTVVNRGPVATSTPHWVDRVYLSLDNKPGADDILLATVDNGSALDKDEAYTSTTSSAIIPERFRGHGYFLVIADADGAVDEYPAVNENNNYAVKEVFVQAQPLADLVTSAVIVPVQAVYSSEISIRFTVTNNGSATTNRSSWTDTVWIAKDPTRPSPGPRSVLTQDGSPILITGNDAIQLGTFSHSGALAVGDSYDQIVKVRIPADIISGVYYITAWADAYDAVLEDQLAINVNPDDPTTVDSSNFKGHAIDIIGAPVLPLPDLQVTSITTNGTVDSPASINKPLVVSWTVRNFGEGVAVGVSGTWYDNVYVHDTPNLTDPGAKVWFMGSFERLNSLDPLASYTQTKTFDLSPATKGLYVTVYADANPFVFVIEDYSPETIHELNNTRTVSTAVVAFPADLVVTSITVPAQNFSGEETEITWTVRNDGAAIWSGTRLWSDKVWISPDPVFGSRAIPVATEVHAAGSGLAHGESYTESAKIRVPAGFDGPYFIYVATDQNTAAPITPGSTEAQSGENDYTRGYYGSHVYEGFADNNNNLRTPIDVIYREPDLKISVLTLPSGPLFSGQEVTVTFTVVNQGTRDTREWAWYDRLYLSLDPSLDKTDLQLGTFTHLGGL